MSTEPTRPNAASIARGRQIAESMMDRATAEYRCVACGASLTSSCNEAHPQHDTYHPDGHRRPEPTWRDVIRAFLKIGPYLLERVTTGETRRWRYETNQRTKGGLRELVDIYHYPTESIWLVKLGLHGNTHMVSLKNPTPAEVLTAARLVGLGGTS
jgi:hypothetical protein